MRWLVITAALALLWAPSVAQAQDIAPPFSTGGVGDTSGAGSSAAAPSDDDAQARAERQARCRQFLDTQVLGRLENAFANANPAVASAGWSRYTAPFATTLYPPAGQPLSPAMGLRYLSPYQNTGAQPYVAPYLPPIPRAPVYGGIYQPNIPPPMALTPLNSGALTGLLAAGGAINPLAPQNTAPAVLQGLAALQGTEANRVSDLWSLSQSYQNAAQIWNTTDFGEALTLVTYAQASGICSR